MLNPQRPTKPFSVDLFRPVSFYAPTLRQGRYPTCTPTLSPSSSKVPPQVQHKRPL